DPHSTCFCTTAGCGPFHEQGLDVLLADAGDHFLAKVITEKGEKLLQSAGWNTETDAGEQIETLKKEAESRITSSVSTDKLKDKVLNELYQAPFWEETAFSCINCGTCTYVCPTCWCFDIQDENHGKSGIRMRNWDSCMYPLFTIHGTGHNPRGTKMHRVRQRFMHKLKYYVDKYDSGIQCVGCGRCVRLCPVNIDIRNVCELMNSYEPVADACQAA
ncbi:MAG: 4Fe-4S ferredoxin, partial [Deltaproteobacteria bacterium]